MDLVSGYKGVVGLVFWNENSGSSEDSYIEKLLDRISNGVLAEDRRLAMTELQSVIAESNATQLAFGTMGFPVLIGVLKEERDDVEMVRGALETLVGALTPLDHGKKANGEVQPALMNTDLLSREADSIALLLSILAEEDFYIRYYTLQLLTVLLNNSPNRLQEVILTVPGGIIRLMDMLMDREVIRNEALLLLTFLTREAEGAFEKIFSIIKEEGGADGGVVVQRVQIETLKRDLQETCKRVDILKTEKSKIESEASMYQNIAGKMESDLKSLSDAYNRLEQANYHLEKEVKSLRSGGATPAEDNLEEIKAQAREEAQKESEGELNDLLVCLGQEQSKVEKLTSRLLELGEDVDKLLQGIGDDMALPEEDEDLS